MIDYSKILSASAVSVALLVPVGASAATLNNPFDIAVNFTGGLSATQQSVFSAAESFWESRITGNRYDLALPALQIGASGAVIDGVGGTLGQAGPQTGLRTNGAPQDFAYATSGIMRFDTADLGALETSGRLFDVIVHEMAHVIGFGSFWNPAAAFGSFFAGTQNVYTDGTGQYTGAFGLAAYNAEFGLNEGYIPVELDGGTGTADAHWDEETFAGGSLDIMTGFLGGVSPDADAPLVGSTLSDATVASFADIGYRTVVTDPMTPVPLPAAAFLLLGALGALGAVARRRQPKSA